MKKSFSLFSVLFFIVLSASVFAQVAITPAVPYSNNNLVCGITGANPAAYMYSWYKLSGGSWAIQPSYVSNTVPFTATTRSEQWRCQMFVPPTPYTGIILVGEGYATIQNTPPTATVFASPSGGVEGLTVIDITGSANDFVDFDPITYVLNFGDGSATTTNPSASHTYMRNGIYTISLTASDNAGGQNTATATVIIADRVPQVNFFNTALLREGFPVNFTDASTSYDPIVQRRWDFNNDGVIDFTSATMTTNHTYMANGTYTVNLTDVDNDGSARSAVRTFVIADNTPRANFTQNATINEGQFATFNSTSAAYPDPIVTYQWNFGDGTIISGPQSLRTHQYMNNKTYTVRLNVTDSDGSMSTKISAITVNDLSPRANFSVSSRNVTVGQIINFTSLSSSFPDTIARYQWNFSGLWINGPANTTHSYAAPGNYNTFLRVTDSDGSLSQSGPIAIRVNALPPAPSINVTFGSSETNGTTFQLGTLRFNGTILSPLPNQRFIPNQTTYSINYTPANGFRFWRWMPAGGITVANAASNSTTFTVTSSGSIYALYLNASVPVIKGKNYTVALSSVQNKTGTTINRGTITFNAIPHALNTSILITNSSYLISYTPTAGFSFLRWNATQKVRVTNNFTNPTTAIVTGNGSITAIYFNTTGAPIHDINISKTYLPPSPNGIRINDSTGDLFSPILNLTQGKKYTIRFRINNNRNPVGAEDANVTIYSGATKLRNYIESAIPTFRIGSVTVNASALTLGLQNITVNATIVGFADSIPADNFRIRIVRVVAPFVPDITPPTVVIVSPTNNTNYTIANIPLQYSRSDASGISSCRYRLDAGALINLAGCINTTFSVTNGTHTLRLFVNDTVFNQAIATRIFHVNTTGADVQKPTWLQLPMNKTVEFGFPFKYDVNATDNVMISRYSVNDTRFRINQTGMLENNTGLSLGLFVLRLSVNDTSNNILSRIITVRVQDTIAPRNFALNKSAITDRSIVINWSTNEFSNSTVRYGLTLGLLNRTVNLASVFNHSIILNGLLANKTYNFNITSCDASSNCKKNGTFSFKTKAASTIFNSWVNGTFYSATNTRWKVIDNSPITNSAIKGSSPATFNTDINITLSKIISSNITNSYIVKSKINISNVNNSIITNSNVTRCRLVKGYIITNSNLVDCLTDPPVPGNIIVNSTIINSVIMKSNITNSFINKSSVTNSTVKSSTTLNSTVMKSISSGSTLTGTSLVNSNATKSTLSNTTIISGIVSNSVLKNIVATKSNVTNTSLANVTLTNAVITNSNIVSGSMTLSNGVVVSTPGPVPYPPRVTSITPASGTVGSSITFVSNAFDPNNDIKKYDWTFGVGQNRSNQTTPTFVYNTATVYSVNLRVTDFYNQTASYGITFTASNPAPSGGSGGGGGGNSGSSTPTQQSIDQSLLAISNSYVWDVDKQGNPFTKTIRKIDTILFTYEGTSYALIIKDVQPGNQITMRVSPTDEVRSGIKGDTFNFNIKDKVLLVTPMEFNYDPLLEFRTNVKLRLLLTDGQKQTTKNPVIATAPQQIANGVIKVVGDVVSGPDTSIPVGIGVTIATVVTGLLLFLGIRKMWG